MCDNNPFVKIRSIKFKGFDECFTFNEDDIVLFVGANNAGKSRTLKDIRDKMLNNQTDLVLIEDIQFTEYNFKFECIKRYMEENLKIDSNGSYTVMSEDNCTQCYDLNYIRSILGDNSINYGMYNNRDSLYRLFYVFLSTENRLNLTKPIILNFSPDNQTLNVFNKLRNGREPILKVNELLNISFGKGIEVCDPEIDSNAQFKYKIGNAEEIDNIINSNRRDVYDELKKFPDLYDQGDGIRSAVAILSSLVVNKSFLYFIDEPETFLHPPQARQLGRDIAHLSEGKQCFIATHNIDFIRGVLEAGSKRVKIIKINRNENTNQYFCLNNEDIKNIAEDKNLKFSNILNGLFYKKVIICEDETDCKFYSTILEAVSPEKYQITLFCAVGGKDQFKKVIPLLEGLKIDYAIVADLDLINDKDKLKQLLNSIDGNCYNQIADQHAEFLKEFEEGTNSQVKKQSEIKEEIRKIFDNAKSDEYMSDETAKNIRKSLKRINDYALLKSGGTSNIPNGACMTKYRGIHNYLKENHIYLVECGEIENFIPTVEGHGGRWVECVFEQYEDLNNCEFDKAKEFVKSIVE